MTRRCWHRTDLLCNANDKWGAMVSRKHWTACCMGTCDLNLFIGERYNFDSRTWKGPSVNTQISLCKLQKETWLMFYILDSSPCGLFLWIGRLWSACTDEQADLSLPDSHIPQGPFPRQTTRSFVHGTRSLFHIKPAIFLIFALPKNECNSVTSCFWFCVFLLDFGRQELMLKVNNYEDMLKLRML